MKVPAAATGIYFYPYKVNEKEVILVVYSIVNGDNTEYKLVVTENKKEDETTKYIYGSTLGDYTVTSAISFTSEKVEVVKDKAAGTDTSKHYVYANGNNGYNYILSETLIPEISLEIKDWGLKPTDFVDLDLTTKAAYKMTGKIAVRSTIHPGAVEFRAVAVDKNNKGYRIANVGYLTNVNLSVAQVNEQGRICVYDDNGGIKRAVDKAIVSINLSDVAKNFINFKNATVIVDYAYMYNEHVLTTTMDGQLAIPTGNVYTGNADRKTIEKVNWSEGVKFDVAFGSQKVSVNGTDYDVNQIKITKITIQVGEKTLFVRNYY